MLVGGTGPLDRHMLQSVYVGGEPALIAGARGLTLLGEPDLLVPASLALALALWWRGQRRSGVTLVVVVLVGRLLGMAQKYEIARFRPEVEPHLVFVESLSFPSGHAAGSMIFYLTLALLLTRRGPARSAAVAAAVLLSLGIGTSRVMVGVHWPSDVVGGWAFGLLWVMLALPVAEWLFARGALRH